MRPRFDLSRRPVKLVNSRVIGREGLDLRLVGGYVLACLGLEIKSFLSWEYITYDGKTSISNRIKLLL
jgi:hypothetical protein